MYNFTITRNNFLRTRNVLGYFHQYYTGFGQPDNPQFILTLKNTFNGESITALRNAKKNVIDILLSDLPQIIEINNFTNCMCICVPRAKTESNYVNNQLLFKDAVKIATSQMNGVIDGTDTIIRVENTFTTHLSKATREGKVTNDGEEPYPGITVDTCRIDKFKIMGKNIILIDDIYTKNINIDEDCIQALFNNGAKNIIYYSIGYTRRN